VFFALGQVSKYFPGAVEVKRGKIGNALKHPLIYVKAPKRGLAL